MRSQGLFTNATFTKRVDHDGGRHRSPPAMKMKKENSKKGKINNRKKTQTVSLIDGRFFPCRSNEEVLQALVTILHPSVRVEVAGGIVRHGW